MEDRNSNPTDRQVKIRIENLIKIYGKHSRHALKMFREGASRDEILEATSNVLGVADVSMNIYKGELFVVMGLSGSGKSTLVRCINRLIPSTSGHIFVDDENIPELSEERLREIRRTKMTMVFQRFALFPHRTVAENVEYGLKVRNIEKEDRRQKALDTLEVVGLSQWADRLPSSLSGGMQQRVGLARALATDAEILLMDEAFGALDPLIRRGMQDELVRLQNELHKTIVFISHDIQEALKIGDRVAVMKDGYLVQVGTPEELISQPADDYIRDFTADVNRAQVLKTGTIARTTVPVILGRDSVQAAREQIERNHMDYLYVVNHQGVPVGFVTPSTIEEAIEDGYDDVTQVMRKDFPTVHAASTLEEIFHLYEKGMPLAVVDAEGKFKGAIEQSDVLSSIGRLSKGTQADSNQANGSKPSATGEEIAV
ncbi:glycine betaine/L-proline ABC transporter ATP-binding protein [Geitlerinema sp. PCC 9228]|uniref:quaternary amine ABC transporter ATP-binding protein n=1 Tax=Geitlerinema sp. PCC 9228 TaxID=111611 RepID=UPI0008F9D640|nr:glycine betaine/L-proline ABC transporter ATP-binding protein [Geitlerinema sp. PCC 9228]